MPDAVELSLKKVLKGIPLENAEAEICDYSLEEQCEALEAQGKQPKFKYTADYKPTLGVTVTYIVACVVINESDEVLMMQEAKKSCAGKWYLPAGRMEKGEDIVTACKREVLEETGLKLECTTLLCVESSGGNWIRFVLTGKILGGKLKTPSEADQESLQAKWIRNLDELELRSHDIRILVDRARLYNEARLAHDNSWFTDQLPGIRPYTRQLLRLVIVIKKKETNKVHILLSEKTSWHLPTCEIHPVKSLHSTLKGFMVYLFGADVPEHRPHGLLSIEYDSSMEKEGLCLTLLVAFRCPLEDVPIIGKCVWHEAPKELGDALLRRLSSRNSTFPLKA